MNIVEQLAYGARILALEGQNDMVWGHISGRDAGTADHFFMKPAGIGLDEVTPKDLITVDMEGRKIAGRHPRHIEVFIHSEILKARSDVNCVIHTHPPHAIAFGALNRPLLPIGHHGSYFAEGVPTFSDTPDMITTPELGQAVVRTLGDRSALFLQNHGIVAVGQTVAEAVFAAVLLEKACEQQLFTEAAGGAKAWPSQAVALAEKEHLYGRVTHHTQLAFDYYVRKLRPGMTD